MAAVGKAQLCGVHVQSICKPLAGGKGLAACQGSLAAAMPCSASSTERLHLQLILGTVRQAFA